MIYGIWNRGLAACEAPEGPATKDLPTDAFSYVGLITCLTWNENGNDSRL